MPPSVIVPTASRSTSGASSVLKAEMVFVLAKIASVIFSGAGPPFDALYLMPKSPSGPPGLWLADRMMPPNAFLCRMRFDAAGVDRIPPCPTITRPKPLAAAIFIAVWMVSRLKYRPSPPMTRSLPSNPSRLSKID